MRRLFLAVVLLAACSAGEGAAINACEEFITGEVGDVTFSEAEVEDRGEGVYRVTGTVHASFSDHAYECQVRQGGGEWTLELLDVED